MVIALLISEVPVAMAGWTGAMNGTGLGKASVNVLGFQGDKPKSITTTNMMNPSVAMTNTSGYVFGTALPKDASSATVAKVRGFPAYVWDATTVGSNGDSTDSTEFPGVQINPADCASLEMISSSVIAPDDKSGTITVQAIATAGTGLRVRGYEALGTLPEDNPNTEADETLDFLKANGLLKWDITLLGPFNLNSSNCTAVTIPFTVATSASNNLYFVTDGVAKSLPLIITCPPSFSVSCEESFVYPPVQFAGCGDVTLAYQPANIGTFPAGSFPVGVTPVTVTATDKDGNSTNCTFTVTVTDTKPPEIPVLTVLTNESSVTVPVPPTTTDNCGGTVTATTTNSLVYTNQGTFTVYWNFDDGHGNTNTAAQTVIVDDVTPPVAPSLGVSSFQCSATVTVPTATDAVSGTITGTTTDPLTYNSLGTFTVHWTFNDGNGNISTANQTVIVQDTIPPVKPTLATITGACGAPVTLTAPTTTDNCAGTVTGTTTNSLVCNTPGTNTVYWTFNDGNGNSSTATQKVIVTSLTFTGFYSPINGTGGTCAAPLIIKCVNSTLPIKFDMKCGTTPITGGTPPVVRIQTYSANCAAGAEIVVQNAVFQNDWHYNWSVSNRIGGTYKITVILPDGTSRYVFVKLK